MTFNPADAVAMLDEFESLTQRYYSLTQRSLVDDWHLRHSTYSVLESSEAVQVDDTLTVEAFDGMVEGAFRTLLASGERVAHLGEDDRWQEANYYQHLADTEDALKRAGVYPEVADEEGDA